jgi:hypothetical protein
MFTKKINSTSMRVHVFAKNNFQQTFYFQQNTPNNNIYFCLNFAVWHKICNIALLNV